MLLDLNQHTKSPVAWCDIFGISELFEVYSWLGTNLCQMSPISKYSLKNQAGRTAFDALNRNPVIHWARLVY